MDCVDLDHFGAREQLVGDRAGCRLEDHVDRGALRVERLVEPPLGRLVDVEADGAERPQRAVGVLGLDEEVDVVVGVGAAVGVDRDAPGERKRDFRVPQGARGLAHGGEEGFEVVRHAQKPYP